MLLTSWVSFAVMIFGLGKTVQFIKAPRDNNVQDAQRQANAWCESIVQNYTLMNDTNVSSLLCQRLESKMIPNNGTSGCVEFCMHIYNTNQTYAILKCNDDCVNNWSNVYQTASLTIDSTTRFVYFMMMVCGGSMILVIIIIFSTMKYCEPLSNRPHGVVYSESTPRLHLETI